MERSEAKNKILTYLKQNISNYTEKEFTWILENYDYGLNGNFAPDILRQIYDELGIIKDEDNMYAGFVDILENKFNINSNIIEVGSGVIPSIAKRISLKQNKGTITVYDPRVMPNYQTNERLVLKKERFTNKTKVNKANLLIGFMPCTATELIIEKAVNNKKDFLIGLCEGGCSDYDDYYDENAWLDYICDYADTMLKKKRLGKLEKTDLKIYGDPYPVIYSKRRN